MSRAALLTLLVLGLLFVTFGIYKQRAQQTTIGDVIEVEVSDEVFSIGQSETNDIAAGRIRLVNNGSGAIPFEIRGSCSCMSFEPNSGNLEARSETIIEVDVSMIEPGQRRDIEAFVITENNGRSETIVVPIKAYWEVPFRLESRRIEVVRTSVDEELAYRFPLMDGFEGALEGDLDQFDVACDKDWLNCELAANPFGEIECAMTFLPSALPFLTASVSFSHRATNYEATVSVRSVLEEDYFTVPEVLLIPDETTAETHSFLVATLDRLTQDEVIECDGCRIDIVDSFSVNEFNVLSCELSLDEGFNLSNRAVVPLRLRGGASLSITIARATISNEPETADGVSLNDIRANIRANERLYRRASWRRTEAYEFLDAEQEGLNPGTVVHESSSIELSQGSNPAEWLLRFQMETESVTGATNITDRLLKCDGDQTDVYRAPSQNGRRLDGSRPMFYGRDVHMVGFGGWSFLPISLSSAISVNEARDRRLTHRLKAITVEGKRVFVDLEILTETGDAPAGQWFERCQIRLDASKNFLPVSVTTHAFGLGYDTVRSTVEDFVDIQNGLSWPKRSIEVRYLEDEKIRSQRVISFEDIELNARDLGMRQQDVLNEWR